MTRRSFDEADCFSGDPAPSHDGDLKSGAKWTAGKKAVSASESCSRARLLGNNGYNLESEFVKGSHEPHPKFVWPDKKIEVSQKGEERDLYHF